MKVFRCKSCSNLLYFENSACLVCGHAVGFEASKLDLITLQAGRDQGVYADFTNPTSGFRRCLNSEHGTCNWLIPVDRSSLFCAACALNRTIPFLTTQNRERWERIEVAKHRLIYSLLRLGLPFQPKVDGEGAGLAFDFLADAIGADSVMTGHEDGVITLNIEEADEAMRVHNKLDLGEKYRTLLGHFRHEIGHYYWDILVKGHARLYDFRQLFGDETRNYKDALQAYYAQGPEPQWSDSFISPYAASHPWEDWAESWAHYLHMMDTLETAHYFGLRSDLTRPTDSAVPALQYRDPYAVADFQEVFNMWLPLAFAVNSLNRSMGHVDFYPFVIAPAVVRKLQFIHNVCRSLGRDLYTGS